MEIYNLPLKARDNPNLRLPYVVASLIEGEWWSFGQFDDLQEAYDAAYAIGGEVFLWSDILA